MIHVGSYAGWRISPNKAIVVINPFGERFVYSISMEDPNLEYMVYTNVIGGDEGSLPNAGVWFVYQGRNVPQDVFWCRLPLGNPVLEKIRVGESLK